jgi:hypothetical protein
MSGVKLPIPVFPIKLPPLPPEWTVGFGQWTFWSFNLNPGISFSGSTAPFTAEVIFGVLRLVVVHRVPVGGIGSIGPITDLQQPLDNSFLVGVCAAQNGIVGCDGVNLYVENVYTGGVQTTTPVTIWTRGNLAGTTSLTVRNGVATLNSLAVQFIPGPNANPLLTLATTNLTSTGAALEFTLQDACAGTWQHKTTWTQIVTPDRHAFSVANPPLPPPPEPAGGEFSK